VPYASIAPLIIYGLQGTSRTLAVGPVVIVSLLVASGISPLAIQESTEYIQLALTLAFLVAVILSVLSSEYIDNAWLSQLGKIHICHKDPGISTFLLVAISHFASRAYHSFNQLWL